VLSLCHQIIAGFLFGLPFEPEDGGATILRIVGGLLPNYTALEPRKPFYSFSIFQFVLNVGG
jgi:hypothetical protein